ncbi:putative porin [Oxalobacteraceae bacterium GrIS 1.11]
MKIWYLALVILTPLAACAQVQRGAGTYGMSERACDNCASARLAAGEQMMAVFALEGGGDAFGQDGRLFGRQAYAGLDGKLGALTMGRQYNPQYQVLTGVADSFRGGMAGAGNLMGYSVKRYDNTIQYATPPLHGLVASAMYSFGESPYSSAHNRAYGAMLGYATGVVNLSVAHQRKDDVIGSNGIVPALDTSTSNTLLAANFHFGPTTAFAAYGVNRGLGSSPWDPSAPYSTLTLLNSSSDSRDTLLGLSMPFGGVTYMASFIRKADREASHRDAHQVALGMTYSLSRRTDFYASYAKIKNLNGAAYTVGTASDAGRATAAFNIGLHHSF